jgi:hypothetical protein
MKMKTWSAFIIGIVVGVFLSQLPSMLRIVDVDSLVGKHDVLSSSIGFQRLDSIDERLSNIERLFSMAKGTLREDRVEVSEDVLMDVNVQDEKSDMTLMKSGQQHSGGGIVRSVEEDVYIRAKQWVDLKASSGSITLSEIKQNEAVRKLNPEQFKTLVLGLVEKINRGELSQEVLLK